MILDGVPYRVAERLAGALTGARRRWRRRRPRPTAADQLRRLEAWAPRDAAWHARALAFALRAGAADDAARHAAALTGEAAGRAALPLLEFRILVGERDAALDHARRFARELSESDAGATALHALGVTSGVRLPGGRLDAVEVARRIEAGDAGALIALSPVELLRRPELHLLAWNAARRADPPRAAAALGRYLRSQRLPALDGAAATDNALAGLRFAPPRPHRGGPLVSVLIAAHRAAATLGYAARSILAQSHRDLELLICDDASDDDTLAVARRLGDPRVRLFRSRRNQGPYNIRNALLAEARGALIAVHDADDVALPGRLAAQIDRLRHTGADLSYTTLVRVAPDGGIPFYRDQSAARLALASSVIRREVVDRLGGFRPARFGADLDFLELARLRLGERAIDVVRQPQVFCLASRASLTRTVEAAADGYRAPGRRAYSQLLFDRAVGRIDDDAVGRRLRDLGIHVEPSGIDPL